MAVYKIDIEVKTIVKVFGVIFSVLLLYTIKDILIQVFISIILMTALNPLVSRIQRILLWGGRPISRFAAVIFTYLCIILIIFGFLMIVAQPLTEQTTRFITQIPRILNFLNTNYNINLAFISSQTSQLGTISTNIVGFISGVFSNLFAVFTTVVLSFYLLLEREDLHIHLANLLRNKRLEKRISFFIDRLEIEMGGWVRAQLLLMLIIGFISYLGFLIMGIPYALPLAIIAGGMEIVPNIGPVLAAVPASLAGFSISVQYGMLVLGWAWFIQILENHFIVPQLMERNTGVNPLVTILVLLIGYALAGISGAILSVPVVIIVRAVLNEFFEDGSEE